MFCYLVTQLDDPCYSYLDFCMDHHPEKYSTAMTQCINEFTYASHCVSKNLTPGRMLENSFFIAQIIRWNNSFQNIYDML